ncbi:hypothetical protein BC937DRAFT_87072 [Endogone sp. FLAS-F59071]|nr:hypothetical protein BC937DRAFT_87072 [Endogone sp. FLAS-F59071]|eukprot:RUS12768.1 hypothetical protein BC937DRAFT_87072 [Endogone sp. FLAS-F59071]
MISFVDIATHTSETHLLRDTGGFDLGRLEQRRAWWLPRRLVGRGLTTGQLCGWDVRRPDEPAGRAADGVAASFVVALLARGLHHHVCFTTVVLSGIVVLLPGFMLTLSIMEVSSSSHFSSNCNIVSLIAFYYSFFLPSSQVTSRNINSGATRLLTSVMDAFFQGFGASLGLALWEAIEPRVALDMSTCSNKIDPRWLIVLFPIIVVSINVQFGALPRQLPLCIVVNSASFIVSYVVGFYVDGMLLPTAIAGGF